MLRLFLPKTPGFKIMNVSIFDTFTDSPLCDHFWPFACVNRLKRGTVACSWLNISKTLNNIKNGISLKFFSVSELKFCMEGGNVWKF